MNRAEDDILILYLSFHMDNYIHLILYSVHCLCKTEVTKNLCPCEQKVTKLDSLLQLSSSQKYKMSLVIPKSFSAFN